MSHNRLGTQARAPGQYQTSPNTLNKGISPSTQGTVRNAQPPAQSNLVQSQWLDPQRPATQTHRPTGSPRTYTGTQQPAVRTSHTYTQPTTTQGPVRSSHTYTQPRTTQGPVRSSHTYSQPRTTQGPVRTTQGYSQPRTTQGYSQPRTTQGYSQPGTTHTRSTPQTHSGVTRSNYPSHQYRSGGRDFENYSEIHGLADKDRKKKHSWKQSSANTKNDDGCNLI